MLNFDTADIETVIHAASEIVGFNYVLAPDVRGKSRCRPLGAYPGGLSGAARDPRAARLHRLKAGNLYKVIRIEGARERAVPTIIGAAPDPQRLATDEFITQIVPCATRR